MPSGKMAFTNIKDKKIMIYKGIHKDDDCGISETTWEPISKTKLWASYRSLSGGEHNAARTAGFEEDVQFLINWRSDIVPGMHIVYRDKVYEITRVDDFEGYKKDLKLICKWLVRDDLEDYPKL